MNGSHDIMRCLMVVEGRREAATTLASLLEEQGLRVRWAGEGQECLHLLHRTDWDLLVLDASGSSHGALSLLSQARKTHPDLPILVLVYSGHVATAVEAMKAGAADCVEIPIEPARVRSTTAQLRRVLDAHGPGPIATLTPVERVVLHHVLEGRTTRGIAQALSRSPRTIDVHRRNVLHKLRASSFADLVKRAMQVGLFDQADDPQRARERLGSGVTHDAPTRDRMVQQQQTPESILIRGNGPAGNGRRPVLFCRSRATPDTGDSENRRRGGSAAAPCVVFPAEHLAAARDYWNHDRLFESGGRGAEAGERLNSLGD